jgi:VWFA-related protein
LLALADGRTAPAQQASPERPNVEIIPPVEGEVVQVDVVVTDKQGRPVTGLKPEDFLLLEDGRPQRLSHFLVGAGGHPAEESPEAAPGEAPPVEAAPPGRHIVLAVDDLHMAPSSMAEAKKAMRRFIDEQMDDEDEMAVVTTSGAVGVFEPFTRERFTLRRAVDRLSDQQRRADSTAQVYMSEFQAQSIERGDADALDLALKEIMQTQALTINSRAGPVMNPQAEAQARALARMVLSEAMDNSLRSLDTLEQVVRHIAPVPGRKLVILVSDGFLLGEGSAQTHGFDLRRLIDASTRAGVAVYALDSRGLTAAGALGGDASSSAPLVLSAPSVRERLQRFGERAQRESLATLADGTGGFLVHGSNDLALGLTRILHDSDSCYLMAYVPSHGDRDGRFHKIEVKLPRHPELHLRARKGYFAPDDRKLAAAAKGADGNSPRREREIKTGLTSLFPLRGVPLRLASEWLQTAGGPELVLRAYADLSGVRFNRVGDRYKAELELLSVVYDAAGKRVGEMEGQQAQLSLTRAHYEDMLREGLRYHRTLQLAPGRYQVHMVAREGIFGQLGSATQWIEIPDLSQHALTLSSVFLFAEAGAGAARPPQASPPPPTLGGPEAAGLQEVQALRRFEHGKGLYYLVYVYNPVWRDDGDTDVVLQAQVWSGEKLMGASPVQLVPFAERSSSPVPMGSRVSLEGLAPGAYELRLLASDRIANANTLRRVAFTVE